MAKVRLDWLDYLRGFLACAVMVYHFTEWNSIRWPEAVASLVGKSGPIAVSGFYIISGYSIAYVYFRKSLNFSFLASFAAKRFFRLAPLLWLAILLSYLVGYEFSFRKLLLNVSLLFGFVAHDRYIATGSWSIGNEMVFYALFPLLMIFPRPAAAKIWCVTVLCGSLVFAVWAALSWIPSSASEEVMWSRYIHPANQFWLFAAGVVLCLFRDSVPPARVVVGASVLALALFVLFPASGSAIYEGWSRIVLCVLLVAVVWAFGLFTLSAPSLLGRPLHYLGAWSYSIYLLHPIANSLVKQVNESHLHISPGPAALLLAIPLSLAMSAIAYRCVEQSGMSIGKIIAARIAD